MAADRRREWESGDVEGLMQTRKKNISAVISGAFRNTQTHRHTDTQTHRHTDTQTHRHTDTQTHRHTDTQTHRHTDTQTHRHTDTQTHRHTDTHTEISKTTLTLTLNLFICTHSPLKGSASSSLTRKTYFKIEQAEQQYQVIHIRLSMCLLFLHKHIHSV